MFAILWIYENSISGLIGVRYLVGIVCWLPAANLSLSDLPFYLFLDISVHQNIY